MSSSGSYYCRYNPDGYAHRKQESDRAKMLYADPDFIANFVAAREANRPKFLEMAKKNLERIHRENLHSHLKGIANPLTGRKRPKWIIDRWKEGVARYNASKKALDKVVENHNVVSPMTSTSLPGFRSVAKRSIEDEFSIGEIADRIFDGDFDGF